ncbi:MAG: ribonuclease HII [Chloroflexi bacterium]|nr:ribonuclease HII [Chloroflexota bacterium]
MSDLPTGDEERALVASGFAWIAGVDEVGRGCLAGPVVAAAVIFPPSVYEQPERLAGVRDSKTLGPEQRALLAEQVRAVADTVGIGLMPTEVVDRLGISPATRLAMQMALAELARQPDLVLLDYERLSAVMIPQRALVHGDARSLVIAAASIVAKTWRDRLMIEQVDREYPRYGFARHKGYGTAAHLTALQRWGPCPVHRRSFAPVRKALT